MKAIYFAAVFAAISASAQSVKPKSYVISKTEHYTIDVKDNKPSVVAFSQEKKWVGDKDNDYVKGNRIDYAATFEDITDIDAYSISPSKKKEKVKQIHTENVQIESIFHHDMKFKYYYFNNLEEGSETFSSYKKNYRYPQFLDAFYFRDGLDVKDSKLELKVSSDVEIGYVLKGSGLENIRFTTAPDGNYTIYTWQLTDAAKEEQLDDAPRRNYYSPHVIFYIKNYKTGSGVKNVVGSVENLYKFYYETVSGINKSDQSEVRLQTLELIKGITSETEKARAIFNYVQSKVHYVAFEDGMGGFVPRDASEVFRKKYGDCKDMANLLCEMLTYAGVESYIAWIGTRDNNYTYEQVPSPIVDNHMIAVAKIGGEYIFLDATGQYTLFPGFTSFIQGKQALLRIDKDNFRILPVPVIPAKDNAMKAKIMAAIDAASLKGNATYALSGLQKTHFNGYYQSAIDKNVALKDFLTRFISNFAISSATVSNDNLTLDPLEIAHTFSIEKWIKDAGVGSPGTELEFAL